MPEPTEHREVERKFRVDSDFALPDLGAVAGVSAAVPADAVSMAATYHDTPTLTLIRWRTTLRRREGGADEGWHLKLPVSGADAGVRDEIHLPLASGATGAVPAALADVVAPLVRGDDLRPMAVVRTVRRPTILRGAAGTDLLELVDDDVTVADADGAVVSHFREVEVEVLDHDDPQAASLLEVVSAALLEAGAEASSLSKAASALGPAAAAPADVAVVDLPADGGLAIDAIASALADHVRRLLLADVGVRRDLPDSVHQMRVAARRLRSVLRTFGSLLDPAWAAVLSEELRWLADELGAIRDTEVLQARLDAHADQLGEPDARLAREIVDERLGSRLQAARSSALAALRSDRHGWLLDDLVEAVRSPRVLDDAYRPTSDVLPPEVARSWRRFAKAVRGLELESASIDWHQARIKGKRARYAVDALVPSGGTRVARFAEAMAMATEALGEHQDAHIAQQALRDLAAGPRTSGPQAFALGRLHDVEVDLEMTARCTFIEQWPLIERAARRSGIL